MSAWKQTPHFGSCRTRSQRSLLILGGLPWSGFHTSLVTSRPSPGPPLRGGRVPLRADCQSWKLSHPAASLLFSSCLATPAQCPFLPTFQADIPPRFYPTSTSLSSDFHHHGLGCHFRVPHPHPSRAWAAPSAWKLLPSLDPGSLPHCLQGFAQMSPTAAPEGHSEIVSLVFSLLFLECRLRGPRFGS